MIGSVRQTADMPAKPRPDGTRPKASFMLEKGIYWRNNLGNTTSFSTLGLRAAPATGPAV